MANSWKTLRSSEEELLTTDCISLTVLSPSFSHLRCSHQVNSQPAADLGKLEVKRFPLKEFGLIFFFFFYPVATSDTSKIYVSPSILVE